MVSFSIKSFGKKKVPERDNALSSRSPSTTDSRPLSSYRPSVDRRPSNASSATTSTTTKPAHAQLHLDLSDSIPHPLYSQCQIVNLAPLGSKINGTLMVVNDTDKPLLVSRLVLVLLSGQGGPQSSESADMARIVAKLSDPESPAACDIHKRPIARSVNVIIKAGPTEIAPGRHNFPFSIPFPRALPPTAHIPKSSSQKYPLCITHLLFASMKFQVTEGRSVESVTKCVELVSRRKSNRVEGTKVVAYEGKPDNCTDVIQYSANVPSSAYWTENATPATVTFYTETSIQVKHVEATWVEIITFCNQDREEESVHRHKKDSIGLMERGEDGAWTVPWPSHDLQPDSESPTITITHELSLILTYCSPSFDRRKATITVPVKLQIPYTNPRTLKAPPTLSHNPIPARAATEKVNGAVTSVPAGRHSMDVMGRASTDSSAKPRSLFSNNRGMSSMSLAPQHPPSAVAQRTMETMHEEPTAISQPQPQPILPAPLTASSPRMERAPTTVTALNPPQNRTPLPTSASNPPQEKTQLDFKAAPLQGTAICDYMPQQPDELSIRAGDVISVLERWEDGWGFGVSLNNQIHGAFPLSILDLPPETTTAPSYPMDRPYAETHETGLHHNAAYPMPPVYKSAEHHNIPSTMHSALPVYPQVQVQYNTAYPTRPPDSLSRQHSFFPPRHPTAQRTSYIPPPHTPQFPDKHDLKNRHSFIADPHLPPFQPPSFTPSLPSPPPPPTPTRTPTLGSVTLPELDAMLAQGAVSGAEYLKLRDKIVELKRLDDELAAGKLGGPEYLERRRVLVEG